nr:MAG TPA: hypothetical protein [Caudoviricetes sp.]
MDIHSPVEVYSEPILSFLGNQNEIRNIKWI